MCIHVCMYVSMYACMCMCIEYHQRWLSERNNDISAMEGNVQSLEDRYCVYVYMCICVYVGTCVYVSVCVFMYICVLDKTKDCSSEYLYMHAYTYIHTD